MTCDCRQRLLDAAAELLVDADRLRRDKRTSRNADYVTTRATAYAASAGYLNQPPREQRMTELATITPDIDRDRYGRPMIVPPGGGKKVAYRRCTTFVGCLEDMYNLQRWQQRNVAVGLADRPDLLLSVAAHRDDNKKLNQLCEDAAEAAKAHAAATTGTAVHALTEIVDRGLELPVIPDGAAADLDAYRKATAGIDWLAIEQGIVVDDLKVHGTPDRIGRLPDGRVVVLDLKTGSVDWGMGKIAMQLAMYAHGTFYDHVGARRTPMPDGLDQSTAIVIHLPAGTGRCDLLEVDIAAGWEGVQVASQVWDWRSRKGLAKPYDSGIVLPPGTVIGPDLFDFIQACNTPDECRALFARYEAQWTPAHTVAAKAHIDVLAASAA